MSRILIVEDETVIRSALRRLLERQGYKVSEAGSVPEAEVQLGQGFDLIISDLRLPGAQGTELIPRVGATPVLIMTSYASVSSAVDAMRLGAKDYIAKPFDHGEMLARVKRILQEQASQAGQEEVTLSDPPASIPGMIGDSAEMLKLYERIRRVAPTDSTVLIHGETGTGKELVARAIHGQSARVEQPLICVNCAAIPETLIESELFGYEKGAFTGAQSNRVGLIEAAEGGTLFLDEIGELPIEAQARLLRFIQEGEIRRIGSVQSRKVDVRLICATHRDLKALAHEGRFRQDLYYRINVVMLRLPPLRERGRDIQLLAEALLARACQQFNRPAMRLSGAAQDAIGRYAWPGNVRELEHALERAVILADGPEIGIDNLDIDQALSDIDHLAFAEVPPTEPKGAIPNIDPPEDLSLEEYFQHFVLEHQDSMSETELAKKLGVSRKCLWERRQRFGIPRKKGPMSKARGGAPE